MGFRNGIYITSTTLEGIPRFTASYLRLVVAICRSRSGDFRDCLGADMMARSGELRRSEIRERTPAGDNLYVTPRVWEGP